jgi:hypothetical protein
VRIRRGGPEDAAAVIALFDEAVAWMVARGQTGQWVREPLSRNERDGRAGARVGGGDGLWMAEDDGATVGALVVGGRPAHVEAAGEPELYGTFDVRGWPGQVFSMRLGHQPGTDSR